MTTPAVIICETTHQKKTSTNKSEELKLAWNWIFSNTLLTIPSFWGMNVKHLITNWQDFLRKNIWHFFTDSGFYTVGYLILKRSLIFEWMGSKKVLLKQAKNACTNFPKVCWEFCQDQQPWGKMIWEAPSFLLVCYDICWTIWNMVCVTYFCSVAIEKHNHHHHLGHSHAISNRTKWLTIDSNALLPTGGVG